MQTSRNIFWNQAEKRLRTGWRLIAQLFLTVLFLSLFQAGFSVIAAVISGTSLAPGTDWDPSVVGLISTIIAGLAITASVFLAARALDKRAISDLGLAFSRSWWREFAFGLGLGVILMTMIFLAELSLGWIEIETLRSSPPGGPALIAEITIALLYFIAIGIYEELFSRGYLIKNLSEGFAGKRIKPQAAILLAGLLTSGFFGFLHAANPNASTLGIINLSLIGILLAAGYLVTGQLALPIGLHITWNFFQGPIFGFPVSGTTGLSGSVFRITQGGPSLWTGGAFGPEGGLIGICALIAGLGLIAVWKGNRKWIDLRLSHYPMSSQIKEDSPSPATQLASQVTGIKHIIWDWNGTLLDDLDMCLDIIGGMLTERNLPAIDKESYLEIFDFPVKDYYQKIGFDFSQEPFETISDQFIGAYEKGRPDCDLIGGAREILAHAARLGLSQSILSASKNSYLLKAVEDYGIAGYFTAVLGIDNHHAAGKLALAQAFLESSSLDPQEMLLVGDTTHDGDIARAIGVNCVLIPNGHHSRSRLEETGFPVIDSLNDLRRILE
jgi:phosphoglycolate phosphatase-like HAD superfamily hydrolase/membrane protease YdiL (CAAX protease family)